MRKKYFILNLTLNLLFLISSKVCFSQNYTFLGSKIFGGNHSDYFVQITSLNNKLVLIGSSASDPNTGNITDSSCDLPSLPNKGEIWTVMFDTSFSILWNKNYGGNDHENHIGSIVNSNNNALLFAVESQSDISCEKSENNKSFPQVANDYWIVKIDSNGIKLLDKTFGTITEDEYPFLTKLSDDNYLLGGLAGNSVSGDKSVVNYGLKDYWVLKFDNIGNKIWDNHYGGTGMECASSGNTNGFNILPLENGSFVISGGTNSPIGNDISEPTFGSYDIWLIKVDSSGNKIWDKRYGGTNSETKSEIIKAGSGFIILSSTKSPQGGSISEPPIGDNDVWVLKLDSIGNKLWDKRYGGIDSDLANSISQDVDNGFIISALTSSPAGNSITDSSFGGPDYWIFKIDSVGNKIWDKRFGGPGNDYVSNFVIMQDSSIFLCGYADSGYSAVKSEFGYGMSDYWVVHFKYGNSTSGIYESNLSKFNGKVYPNPANNSITFEMNNAFIGESITLKDITGRLVYSTPFKNKIPIDIHELKSGPYLYEIRSISGERFYGKVLKYD